jgi:DNA-binding SARP family transcriptional activator
LGPAKIRGLLGILLLSANRAVPIDLIIDRLWDDPPGRGGTKGREEPPDARRTLQGYVSKLRRVLDRCGAPAEVLTEHGHYRLKINLPDVDYHYFRQLADEGQRAYRSGDYATAISKLGQAVDLWQGQPLADLRSAWAQHEAQALATNELVPAYCTLIRAHLALGNGEVALEMLRLLLVDHDTNLSLIELRMRALADVNGKSSVAGYFVGIQERLRRDPGIDPTGRLRRIYDELVADDRSPGSHQDPMGSDRPQRAVPFQLPRDIRGFIGRDEVLQEMDELLAPDRKDVVVALDGLPGVGKTALAIYWAHRRHEWFPDGVLFAELNGYGPGRPVTAWTVLGVFLTSLGVQASALPDDLETRIALLRQHLADRKILVVLDNAFDSAHIVPILTATAPCSVLITSRQRLSLRNYHDAGNNITVPTLLPDESIAFLRRGVGDRRAQQDMAALHDFAAMCDGLPIALRIVGEHVATRSGAPLTELVTHLRRRKLLDTGGHADRGSTTLRAVFDLSMDKLEPETAFFFSALGLGPSTRITTEVASTLTGSSMAETESILETLVCAHLVTQLGAELYGLHDLLYLYAADRMRGHQSEDVVAAVHRMVDWYLYSGTNALRAIAPQEKPVPELNEDITVVPREFRDADEARKWLFAERTNIIGVCGRAKDHGMHDHVWRLVGTFSGLLIQYWEPTEYIDVHNQALTSTRIDGAREGESGILNSLGAIALNQHDYRVAENYFARALKIFREIGDEEGESVALLNLGNTYLYRGRHEMAIGFHRQSLVIFERIGDELGQAYVCRSLGRAYQLAGHYVAAHDYLARSLAISIEIGDQHSQAEALATLGELRVATGQLTAAHDYCAKAREISERISDQRLMARVLRTEAHVCLKLGDNEGAIRCADESAGLCAVLSDTRGHAAALELAADGHQAMGDHARARQLRALAYELLGRSTGT